MVSKLFRAYGLYNTQRMHRRGDRLLVSKLFRAYGLYNENDMSIVVDKEGWFQSSFELMGYITNALMKSKSSSVKFQSSFELMGYITPHCVNIYDADGSFKALSSLWVI